MIIKYIAAYRIYKQEKGPDYKSNDADTIIWVYYPGFKVFKSFFVWDILLMAAVAKNKEKFKLHWGKDIGAYYKKRVIYNVGKGRFDFFKFENYSSYSQFFSNHLEEQQNIVYPSYHDVMYWENKVHMYTRFIELGVHIPRTVFYNSFSELIKNEDKFPFLIKIPHSSGSYGLYNIKDTQSLHDLVTDPVIVANNTYIVQERLNITMDMRVILTGDEIVHYYWRKNKDKSKWRTTSTSNGSSVDFGNFPEQWRAYIIATFKNLNLITGAFDIGWQNDDLSSEPYFFEVSPSYDVNPSTSNTEHLNDYGKYKQKLLFKNSFDRLFIEQTYQFKSKGVTLFLENSKLKNS